MIYIFLNTHPCTFGNNVAFLPSNVNKMVDNVYTRKQMYSLGNFTGNTFVCNV